MSKQHSGNYFKNYENFLKISAIFFNLKNLRKKITKIPFVHSDYYYFFLIFQNHTETTSRFLHSFIAMFLILL